MEPVDVAGTADEYPCTESHRIAQRMHLIIAAFDVSMVHAIVLPKDVASALKAVGRIGAGHALRAMHKSTIPRVIRHADGGVSDGGLRADRPVCPILRLCRRANPPDLGMSPEKISLIF